MLEDFKIELEEINRIQYLFIQKVITNIWKEEIEEWSVGISMYWMIDINDMYLWFDDFIMIAKYEIWLDIFMEWNDMRSLSFQTPRVIEAIKKNKDFKSYNIYMFAKYFYEEKEIEKEVDDDLKKAQANADKAKQELEDIINTNKWKQ